jgi:hypothetical protein
VRLGPPLTDAYSSGLGWSTLMRFARLRAEYDTDSGFCVKRLYTRLLISIDLDARTKSSNPLMVQPMA